MLPRPLHDRAGAGRTGDRRGLSRLAGRASGAVPRSGAAAGDFALVGLVGALVLEGGTVSRAGIGWFGMGPTPIRARQVEAALVGTALDRIDPQTMARLAIADTAPFDDHHASAEYRRTVGARIFARALAETLDLRSAA
ncbi:hypothetical protein ACFSLT_00485 [Novosphingobium resinovorum]